MYSSLGLPNVGLLGTELQSQIEIIIQEISLTQVVEAVNTEDDCSSPVFLPEASTYINMQACVPVCVCVCIYMCIYIHMYMFTKNLLLLNAAHIFTLHVKTRNTQAFLFVSIMLICLSEGQCYYFDQFINKLTIFFDVSPCIFQFNN